MKKPSRGWRNVQGDMSFSSRLWGTWVSGIASEDLHRANGPAVEGDDGTKEWWEHGRLLRAQYSGRLMEEKPDGLLQRIRILEEEVERLKHG